MPARGARRLVGAAVAFALALAPVPATASSHHYGGSPTDTVYHTATGLTDEQQRFVTLWDARFRSGPLFQAYLDSDLVYDDGFNDRSPEEQFNLAYVLVDYWRSTDASFRDHVDWEGVEQDPLGGEDPDAEQQRRPTHQQVVSMVEQIVFHKEEFKQALRGDDEDGGLAAPGTAPENPADTAPADPLGEAALAALAALEADVAPYLARAESTVEGAVDTVEALDDGVAVRTPPEPDVLDHLPSSGDIAGVDFGVTADALDKVVSLTGLEDPPVAIHVPVALAAAGFGPENLVYGVCWQLPAMTSPQCPGTSYAVGVLTQLPGQAAGIDVDNSVFTGLAGTDLEIGLVVDPLTTPGGLGATVTVKRYGTAALNAKGVIRYALPDGKTELRVGFDGRTVTLQGQQAATVVVEDLAGLSAGDVRVKATVSHNGTPGVPTVALVTETVPTVTADTVSLTTSFVRAPAAHTARVMLRRSGTTGLVRVESAHNGATLPDLRVDAAARLGAAVVTGGVTLTSVPATTTVEVKSDDASNLTTVEYRSTSQLARIEAGVQVTPDAANTGTRYTAALDIHRVPTEMDLTLKHDQTTYRANAPIGLTTGLGLTASLEEHVGGALNRRAFAGLSNVPRAVTLTAVPSAQRYVVDTGAGISRVEAAFHDRTQRLTAGLTVTGIPGTVTLTMPTASDPRIVWTTSAPTGSVSANVAYGVWRAGLEVTNVPSSIVLTPATNRLEVTTSGPGATVTAYLTNTGSYGTSPYAGDNYAVAHWRKLSRPRFVRGGVIDVEVQAALKVQGIRRVLVTPGDNTAFDVSAGAGAPLYVRVRVEDMKARIRGFAEVRLVNFPGVVSGTIGATTTLTASANTDLTAYAEYGPTTALLAPLDEKHGLVFRRNAVPGGTLSRARLWLTGLPTSVTIGTGGLRLAGLRPTQPSLVVDIALLDDSAAPVTAYAELAGIPTGVAHTVNATWSTVPYYSGYRTKVSASTTNASFGRLTVRVTYGRYAAHLTTSALPGRVDVTLTEAEGQTVFAWSADAVIANISAGMLTRPSPTDAWSARGNVELTDIPSSFTLTTGRDGGGSGPLVTYTSNGSAQLDATVVADGSLRTTNASIGANLYFRLVDLAPVLSVANQGSGFSLSGGGRTGLVEARVSARAAYTESKSGTANAGSWVRFPWSYRVEITPVLRNLSVTLSNVGSLSVAPGLSTKVSGDYGSVDLRWDGFTVDVKAEGRFRALLDLWVCQCEFTIFQAALTSQWGINPTVRIYDGAWHEVFSAHLDFWCAYLDFKVWVRPTTARSATFTGGINLPGTPGATRTYWLTPAPFGWVRLADVVTGVKAFGGNFVSAWHRAEWVCW